MVMRIVILLILIIIVLSLLYYNWIISEHFTNDLYNKMDIYVINLKSRPNKREFMSNQFKKHNLNVNFFDAINGNELDLGELLDDGIISPDKDKRIKRYLRKGEIGCALSHITIWKKLLNSNKEYALIFEDDAVLCNDFKPILKSIIDEANTVPWDILYLNENCYRHFKKECDGPHVTPRIISPNNVGYGLYGYVIKKDAVKKYIDDILPLTIPVDNYIIEKQKDNDNKILRLKYPIVEINRNFKSDTVGIK